MPRLKGQRSATSWTYDHIETLKRLWGEGKTAGAIAKHVPYSRSAICGMARRQGLPPRPRAVPRRPLNLQERMDRVVDLVADHNIPLRAAAEKAEVAYGFARACFDAMIARYDMGNRPGAGDDLVTAVHA